MLEHKDLAGHTVVPGDFIVYAALWDRSAVLKYGIVTELYQQDKWYQGIQPAVKAITVDRTWKEPGWELQKSGQPVVLSFLDRLLIVGNDRVPGGAQKLLLDAYLAREEKDETETG